MIKVSTIKSNLVNFFSRIEQKILMKPRFQNLAPIDNVNLSCYEDALDFAFYDSNIKNIALTGPYGSGKSSVLESYLKKKNINNVMFITLANFCINDTGATNLEKINHLEGKVLNQILHQIPKKKISQSIFKLKNEMHCMQLVVYVLMIIIYFLSIFLVTNLDEITIFISKHRNLIFYSYLEKHLNVNLLFFCSIYLLIITAIIIYKVIRIFSDFAIIKRFAFKGYEIEVLGKNEDLIFDKYLNEVLYLFRKSDVRMFVFEDIDRFNINIIFQRLREINTILNRNMAYKGKPVKFLYVIKDDLFSTKDRTKFFDFIIPIVPVVDSSNSYDLVIENLKTGYKSFSLDESFLQSISLYIDDMRLLKNIINEFNIYNERIRSTEQNINILFAFIVFKNTMPIEFSNLYLRKGFVYKLFEIKKELLKKRRDLIEIQIRENESKIKEIKLKVNTSESELVQMLNTRIINNTEYERRKNIQLNFKDVSIDDLVQQNSELNNELNNFENNNLQDNLLNVSNEEFFEMLEGDQIISNLYSKIKKNDYFSLLIFLIRNGYINESYADYMSYTYEHSIKNQDKIFLRSVSDLSRKNYNYKINDPKKIISRLKSSDFNKVEILNFDIVNYIIDNIELYNLQYQKFLQLIVRNRDIDFILGILKTRTDSKKFISNVNFLWPEIIEYCLSKNIDKSILSNYCIDSLSFTSLDVIMSMNKNEAITMLISDVKLILIKNEEIDKSIEIFKKLNVQFKNLDLENIKISLWKEIYTNNLYCLNITMIRKILTHEYKISGKDLLNYDLWIDSIFGNPNYPFSNRVINNLEEFLELIINEEFKIMQFSEQYIIQIINANNVSFDLRIKLLNKIQFKFNNIETINNVEIIEYLFSKSYIYISLSILISYFEKNNMSLNEHIIKGLNEQTLNDEDFKNFIALDKELQNAFIYEILMSNDVNIDIYKRFLRIYKDNISNIKNPNLLKERIILIIRYKKIILSVETLNFVRGFGIKETMLFITMNYKDYIAIIKESKEQLIKDEFDMLLRSSIDYRVRLDFIKITNMPLSIIDNKLPTSLIDYIMKNNFDINDLEWLLSNYSSIKTKINLNTLLNLIKKNIRLIFQKELTLEYLLLEAIVQSQVFSNDEVYLLFINSIKNLDSQSLILCFRLLDEKDFEGLLEHKRPLFKKTNVNIKILTELSNKGIVTFSDINDFEVRAYPRKR